MNANKTPPPLSSPKYQVKVPLNVLRQMREGKLVFPQCDNKNEINNNAKASVNILSPSPKNRINDYKGINPVKANYDYSKEKLKMRNDDVNYRKYFEKYFNKMLNKIIEEPNNKKPNNNSNNPNNKPKPKQTQFIQAYKSYHSLTNDNEQNTKSMEDFINVTPRLHKGSYFAVFDGHGGDKVAKYAKDNFHKHILSKLTNIQTKPTSIPQVLKSSFEEFDIEINKQLKQQDTVGSTASIVYIIKQNKQTPSTAYCANVGDSKCYLLSADSTVEQISSDHNCKQPDEVTRVKQAGGCIFQNRVFGTLMLTRSLGDKEMKKYGVSAVPSIKSIELQPQHKYIVLASDGIWDLVPQETLSDIYKELNVNEINSEILCMKLVEYALDNGSTDNISCIVIEI